jgi:hypothetical protein
MQAYYLVCCLPELEAEMQTSKKVTVLYRSAVKNAEPMYLDNQMRTLPDFAKQRGKSVAGKGGEQK